jgi:uncharacterized protein YkwD
MKDAIKIIIVSVISVVIIFGVAGCSPSISQEEYDSVNNELSSAKQQNADLQSKLDEAATNQLQYDQLNFQYQQLKEQDDAKNDEIQSLQSEFDELNTNYNAKIDEIQGIQDEYDNLNQEYDELKKQYDNIVQGDTFSLEDVDQAIFASINQDRKNNGLDELEWGVNLYGWARQNSVAMSQTGDFAYSGWLSVQCVLITAGQSTLDGLVNGVMEVWRQRTHEYNPKILNVSVTYGAVATYKSGDVYYVTYVASISP